MKSQSRQWAKAPPKAKQAILESLPLPLPLAIAIPIAVLWIIFYLRLPYFNLIRTIFLITYVVIIYFITNRNYNRKYKSEINTYIHKERYNETVKPVTLKESLRHLRYFLFFWILLGASIYFYNLTKSGWFILAIAICFFAPLLITFLSQRKKRKNK